MITLRWGTRFVTINLFAFAAVLLLHSYFQSWALAIGIMCALLAVSK